MLKCSFGGGAIFPSRWLTALRPAFDASLLRRLPEEVFALLFPHDCGICAAPLKNISRIPVCEQCLQQPRPFLAEYFCARCRTPFLNAAPLDEDGLCPLCRRGASGFDAAYAFGEYEGALRKLIHLFKYDSVRPLAPVLGTMLSRALPRDVAFDVIVPMPLHWSRKWKRGFNQSELLARAIGKRVAVPVANALTRRKATPHQAGLTRAQRRTNVSGVFEASRPDEVAGKHVLLIDDVLTTGASAAACARALKRAGARQVSVLALARVDRRKGLDTSQM